MCTDSLVRPYQGVVTSPNYPANYPNRAENKVTLQADWGQRIQLAFTNMNLEYHPMCSKDRVLIRKASCKAYNISKCCGQNY